MKKIILFLIFCSSLLISQEIDKTGEGFSVGFKIELGREYKSFESILGDIKDRQTILGMSLPLKYTFNTQWVAEINPGFIPGSVYSLTMGMRCYYFPFRDEYYKNNFLVFLGLDNAFRLNEGINDEHTRSIVSLLFGTGIQRESFAFDLSVSIPFNNHYAYHEKLHVFVRFGATWFFLI